MTARTSAGGSGSPIGAPCRACSRTRSAGCAPDRSRHSDPVAPMPVSTRGARRSGYACPSKWTAPAMRRALNALLPDDLWVADAHAMRDDFHARYSATARAYSYYVGTDDEAASPFRRRTEWVVQRRSTAPRSTLGASAARRRALLSRLRRARHRAGGRRPSLHRAPRRVARRGRRARLRDRGEPLSPPHGALPRRHDDRRRTRPPARRRRRRRSCAPSDNSDVSPPAPPHALFLDRVCYPADLYLSEA